MKSLSERVVGQDILKQLGLIKQAVPVELRVCFQQFLMVNGVERWHDWNLNEGPSESWGGERES